MAQISDLHIEDFCKDTAKTFITLYQAFPQSITLYVEDICGPDNPDEFGLHSPRFCACFSALIWLGEAGYIQYKDTMKQEALEHVTLTHKAFTFLSSTHDEVGTNPTTDTQTTRISTIRNTLINKTSTQLTQLILTYMKRSKNYA